MIEYPKLRAVEAIAAKEDLICLRDPLGFSDQLVFLPREALFVLSLFDGNHSVIDVQTEFARRFGTILPGEKVREIIDQLDSCLFLDSERFQEARRQIVQAFHSARVRVPTHAGTAYQAEPAALRSQLEELFRDLGEAGETERSGSAPPASSVPSSGVLRGLIAPHIDVTRGGPCFASSYAELERSSEAETFVVLGIAHVPTRRRFALCAKDFETPLGVLPLDRDFVAALDERLRSDFYEDEFAHRSEHSVEFQALFLQYLYGKRKTVRLVPVLCGSLERAMLSGLPEDDPEVREFLQAMTGILREREGAVCCIAAVDLSHLGRRFGQELTLSKSFLQQAETDDRRMIDRILARDAEGFFRLIQEERDNRNVCGVPAIYTLLRLLEGSSGASTAGPGPAAQSPAPGRLLRYEQAVEEPTQSVVTFMGAAFYG
jgi:AmmeMemoRadiSam system protein B